MTSNKSVKTEILFHDMFPMSKIFVSTDSSQQRDYCGEYIRSGLDGVWKGPNTFEIQTIDIPQLGLERVTALVWVLNDNLEDPIVCYTKCGNKWKGQAFSDNLIVTEITDICQNVRDEEKEERSMIDGDDMNTKTIASVFDELTGWNGNMVSIQNCCGNAFVRCLSDFEKSFRSTLGVIVGANSECIDDLFYKADKDKTLYQKLVDSKIYPLYENKSILKLFGGVLYGTHRDDNTEHADIGFHNTGIDLYKELETGYTKWQKNGKKKIEELELDMLKYPPFIMGQPLIEEAEVDANDIKKAQNVAAKEFEKTNYLLEFVLKALKLGTNLVSKKQLKEKNYGIKVNTLKKNELDEMIFDYMCYIGARNTFEIQDCHPGCIVWAITKNQATYLMDELVQDYIKGEYVTRVDGMTPA